MPFDTIDDDPCPPLMLFRSATGPRPVGSWLQPQMAEPEVRAGAPRHMKGSGVAKTALLGTGVYFHGKMILHGTREPAPACHSVESKRRRVFQGDGGRSTRGVRGPRGQASRLHRGRDSTHRPERRDRHGVPSARSAMRTMRPGSARSGPSMNGVEAKARISRGSPVTVRGGPGRRATTCRSSPPAHPHPGSRIPATRGKNTVRRAPEVGFFGSSVDIEVWPRGPALRSPREAHATGRMRYRVHLESLAIEDVAQSEKRRR